MIKKIIIILLILGAVSFLIWDCAIEQVSNDIRKFGTKSAKFDGKKSYIELGETLDIEKLDIDNNGIEYEAWVDVDTDGKKVFHFKTIPNNQGANQ